MSISRINTRPSRLDGTLIFQVYLSGASLRLWDSTATPRTDSRRRTGKGFRDPETYSVRTTEWGKFGGTLLRCVSVVRVVFLVCELGTIPSSYLTTKFGDSKLHRMKCRSFLPLIMSTLFQFGSRFSS